jgi:hypothetical protein
MNRIIWIVAALATVVWSLLCWGTYALVTGGGEWLTANADLLGLQPDWQYGLQWLLRLAEQFGAALVWIVWGLGTLTVLVGAWLGGRVLGAARRLKAGASAPAGGPTR